MGEIRWLQQVNLLYTLDGKPQIKTGGEFKLDNGSPYFDEAPWYTPGESHCFDNPRLDTRSSSTSASMFFQARTWLMWTPPGTDHIAVPIQKFEYGYDVSANWDPVAHDWNMTNRDKRGRVVGGNQPINGEDTDELPKWWDKLTNGR
jgi:hypothetical protein